MSRASSNLQSREGRASVGTVTGALDPIGSIEGADPLITLLVLIGPDGAEKLGVVDPPNFIRRAMFGFGLNGVGACGVGSATGGISEGGPAHPFLGMIVPGCKLGLVGPPNCVARAIFGFGRNGSGACAVVSPGNIPLIISYAFINLPTPGIWDANLPIVPNSGKLEIPVVGDGGGASPTGGIPAFTPIAARGTICPIVPAGS